MTKSTRAAAALWFCLASTAHADEAFVDAVLDCRALSSANERLSCYDDIVAAYTDRSPLPAADTATEPAAAVAASVAAEHSFGLPPDADRAGRLDAVELTIKELTPMASGKLAFMMTNGQVWRQTTTSSLRLNEGDAVVIRRGSLGSYKLTKAGTKRSMKVKRVK